jgi:carbohydrate kinase (thermoresistant glucokinase family)
VEAGRRTLKPDVPFARPPVLVLMGVSGCGKSTVGRALADQLNWDFGEGDAMHLPQSVRKMASGHPLTDADRAPWLRAVAAWIQAHVTSGRPGIITCSALRRAYRDVLRDEHVVFVYLHGDREVIESRLAARHGHYMPAALLDSQFATLEPPGPDEQFLTVEIGPDPSAQAAAIIARLALV